MIPVEDWIWQGHAGHYCCDGDCYFQLVTVVGKYLVSTIGDRRLPESPRGPAVKIGSDHYYETMVFMADKKKREQCGCVTYKRPVPQETETYQTPQEAQAGHVKLCKKYAELQ